MCSGIVSCEAILKEQRRLGADDTFRFRCDASLDCFTHCCRDVSIVLTPYDIIRLKRKLGIDSSEFLEKYTISPFTPEQKFPIVLLKMDGDTKCPFVREEGCSVYDGRPWACRMYPLGVADPKNTTPDDRRFHFLIREDLCHGHEQGEERSVSRWVIEQGIEEYEMAGVSFRDLTLHDFWEGGEVLPPEKMDMFYMACYDIDRFRRFVFETRFLDRFLVDEARVEAMRNSDLELLDFAMQWLRFCLFRERTMKLNNPPAEAGRGRQR